MTRSRKSQSVGGRRRTKRSKSRRTRRYKKQRGGRSEGFNDRVPDGALVVVRDADEDSSPFVVMTKEDAMKNYTLGSNRM
jgi:hypothetical protein